MGSQLPIEIQQRIPSWMSEMAAKGPFLIPLIKEIYEEGIADEMTQKDFMVSYCMWDKEAVLTVPQIAKIGGWK